MNERIRLLLSKWGLSEVYVEEEESQEQPRTIKAGPIPATVNRAYRQAVDKIRQAMEGLRRGDCVPLMELGRSCSQLVMKIASEPDVLSYLHLLNYWDDYTFQHSVKVGVLATLLAQWLKMPPSEHLQVATAGVLHDLGKALVPLEILNKPGRLTTEELAVVRTHCLAGHSLLSPDFGSDSIPSRAALEHHERMDGSGYPQRLRAQDTLLTSRIVAVADVYDAMTSDRVYQPRQPGYAVLAQLQESSFSVLDPRVTQTFVEHVVQRVHGQTVRLSNGLVGQVVFVHERDPQRPIVAVGKRLIDLSRQSAIHLVGEA
ncbi:MAG: HD-GYP domain-containing protein [Bacillota bacterium]|nr:HD-GYP domain-containing protein [Bacillota bacterium]